MKYNDLQVSANKNKKRVGRGIAAGQGKIAALISTSIPTP